MSPKPTHHHDDPHALHYAPSDDCSRAALCGRRHTPGDGGFVTTPVVDDVTCASCLTKIVPAPVVALHFASDDTDRWTACGLDRSLAGTPFTNDVTATITCAKCRGWLNRPSAASKEPKPLVHILPLDERTLSPRVAALCGQIVTDTSSNMIHPVVAGTASGAANATCETCKTKWAIAVATRPQIEYLPRNDPNAAHARHSATETLCWKPTQDGTVCVTSDAKIVNCSMCRDVAVWMKTWHQRPQNVRPGLVHYSLALPPQNNKFRAACGAPHNAPGYEDGDIESVNCEQCLSRLKRLVQEIGPKLFPREPSYQPGDVIRKAGSFPPETVHLVLHPRARTAACGGFAGHYRSTVASAVTCKTCIRYTARAKPSDQLSLDRTPALAEAFQLEAEDSKPVVVHLMNVTSDPLSEPTFCGVSVATAAGENATSEYEKTTCEACRVEAQRRMMRGYESFQRMITSGKLRDIVETPEEKLKRFLEELPEPWLSRARALR
jgi:hypothetical protein